EDRRRLLEERGREAPRRARDVGAERTPGGRRLETTGPEGVGRGSEVAECALAARGRTGGELGPERHPAAEAVGTEAGPGRRRVSVHAEGDERRPPRQPVGGGEERRMHAGPERRRPALGRNDRRVVVREPGAPHPKIAWASSPIARWLSGSSVSD